MKRILMLAMAVLGLTFSAKAECPDGYTKLSDGNYSFKVDDEHATDGKWYIKGEFQPVDGATIDGAEWYVDSLIAFQDNGTVLNLQSGKLTWTGTGWGGGVYPGSDNKYLNFVPGSTFVCINPNFRPDQIFSECFKAGNSNFRYNDEKITDEERFKELFTVDVGPDNKGAMFYLTPTDASTPVIGSVTGASSAQQEITVSATFVNPGDPVGTVSAAWATSDLGKDPAAWGEALVSLGTASAETPSTVTFTGVPDKAYVYVRFFAVSGEKTVASPATAIYSHYYGVDGAVNEWLGGAGDGKWSTGGNWTLGHSPKQEEITWIEQPEAEITTSGNLSIYPGSQFLAGTVKVGGEFYPYSGAVLDGINWTCSTYFPHGDGEVIITFKSGSLTVTRSDSENAYYGATITDVPVDNDIAYTIKTTTDKAYNRTFGGKFRYAGAKLAEADFRKLFDVVDNGDGSITVKTHHDSETQPRLGDSVSIALSSTAATKVNVSATIKKAVDGMKAYLAYANEDLGTDISLWTTKTELTIAGGAISSTATLDLDENTTAWMRVFLVNEATGEYDVSEDAFAAYLHLYPGCEGLVVNEWKGAVSESLNEAGNWTLGHVPTESEVRWFENGTVTTSGNYTTRATDRYKGTTFNIGNEFQPVNGTVFDAGEFSFQIFAPQHGGDVFTCHGGSFTATSSRESGFWRPNDTAYCNIPSGSTATFTFKFAKADMGATRGRFKLNGATISSADFNDPTIWTVEETTDAEDVKWTTFSLTPAAEGAPVLEETVLATVDPASATTVTIEATLAEVGGSQPTSFVVNYGLKADQLTESVAFAHDGDYEDNTAVSVQLPNLVAKNKYYFQVVVVNAADTARSEIGSFVTFNLGAEDCAWTGRTSNLASVGSNWSTGVAPTADTDVKIYDVYAEKTSITWDIPMVKSWHQESFAGGEIEVVFSATKDAPVVIEGDATILAGTWTQKGAADEPTKCMNISVGGNLTVAAGAKITTNRTGYKRGKGPGASINYGTFMDGETERQLWTGGSYAGDAGHPTYTGTFVSYGSIVNPLDWGSSGNGDNAETYAGAGLVILSVGGTLTVDGAIDANGFGYNLNDFAGSSGGTVNVTAGAIAGSGKITANGGACNCGPGGAGRIRVALTGKDADFSAFAAPEHITAISGTLETTADLTTKRDTVIGAAGTVTLVAGGETKVVVADTCASVREPTTETLISATHLPASANPTEDLTATQWELLANAKLRLTADAKIAALTVADTATQKVFLDGHTLTVTALTVGGKTLKGTYTAALLNTACGGEVFAGEGTVRAGKFGFAVIIR